MPENPKRAERSLVFSYMLRSLEILEHAISARLTASDLSAPAFQQYMLVYYGLEKYFNKYKQLPSHPEMIQLLEGAVSNTPMLEDRVRKLAINIIKSAYGMKPEDVNSGRVLEPNGMLQRLIDDVKIIPLEKRIAAEVSRERRDELRTELETLYEQTRVVVDSHSNLFEPEMVATMIDDHLTHKSGVDFVDYSIDGFTRPSAIGMLAESGGGKTMFGIQMLVEQVNQESNCISFFYEQAISGDISKRFYSYAAALSREEFKSTHEEMTSDAKQAIVEANVRMKKRCRVYDMSGTVRGQGLGGVSELDTIVGKLIRSNTFRPTFVLVDWLGPLVLRYYQNTPTPLSRKEQLDNALLQLVDLSRRYNLTVLILHQIAPNIMESRKPSFVPGWTVAHECKSFGLLLDYVFTFGKQCPSSGCMWFNVAKARGNAKIKRVVHMDGLNNQIIDASKQWKCLKNPVNDNYFGRIDKGGRRGEDEISEDGWE